MMQMTLQRMAEIAGGRVIGTNVEPVGMIHDTRQIQRGNLYCALPGQRNDGHEFVEQAGRLGAAAALVSQTVDTALPQLLVDDVQHAMGQLAAAWRDEVDAVVIGITGSNGKTTTKEMLAQVLSTRGETLATAGNYNNEIGVPLTLARLSARHAYAVIEMGAARPGDIAYLAGIARPVIGIVTNAAPAHLEGFGGVEAVAQTKGAMFSALPKSGLAVINHDDAYVGLWREMASHCRVITFGTGEGANVSGHLTDGHVRVQTPAGAFEFLPRLPGRHNLLNALAATATAVSLDVPLDDIATALSTMESLPGRLQVHHHDGWTLIDDTYNANPASLYAGLQVLGEYAGERWLVLGDMAELGPDSSKLHAEMGQAAVDMGISRLFTFGQVSRSSALAFGHGAEHFDSRQALGEALANALRPGVTCLVKGSRSTGMEQVIALLVGEEA